MLFDLLVLAVPVVWLFAYASFTRADRKRGDVRILLTIMATAAITAVAAELLDLTSDPRGSTKDVFDIVSGTAALVVIAPFVIFPLARLLGRWRSE
jgi:hypothetical protein